MPATLVRENGESFAFDVEATFAPSRDFEIPMHAIDRAADAADHHRLAQTLITWIGTISDTPNPDSTFEPTASSRPVPHT